MQTEANGHTAVPIKQTLDIEMGGLNHQVSGDQQRPLSDLVLEKNMTDSIEQPPSKRRLNSDEPSLRSPEKQQRLALATLCVHAGSEHDEMTGAVIPPLYTSTTFAQTEPGKPIGDFDYTRAGNPTRTRLETLLASLEGAEYSVTFASGLAAENAIIAGLLKPGDRVVVCDDVYGGTGRLFRHLHQDKSFDFLDLTQPNTLADALVSGVEEERPIKMIWIETPTNPLLKTIDIKAVSELAKTYGALTVVDNTFATPIFQQPLTQGADIVVHSTTKYMGGHSDILGGAVMMSDALLHKHVRAIQFKAGAVPSPHDCELLQRSIKTLHVRMQRHQENAQHLYQFLKAHPKVASTHYPGYSGMISFSLRGDYSAVKQFLANLKLFTLAESLGGVESLINHPEKMTHASVPEALRKKLGIGPNLLRLSVGIEEAGDLQSDLSRALDAVDLDA